MFTVIFPSFSSIHPPLSPPPLSAAFRLHGTRESIDCAGRRGFYRDL